MKTLSVKSGSFEQATSDWLRLNPRLRLLIAVFFGLATIFMFYELRALFMGKDGTALAIVFKALRSHAGLWYR